MNLIPLISVIFVIGSATEAASLTSDLNCHSLEAQLPITSFNIEESLKILPSCTESIRNHFMSRVIKEGACPATLKSCLMNYLVENDYSTSMLSLAVSNGIQVNAEKSKAFHTAVRKCNLESAWQLYRFDACPGRVDDLDELIETLNDDNVDIKMWRELRERVQATLFTEPEQAACCVLS